MITRAGKLAEDIFCLLAEKFYTKNIVHVKDNGRIMVFYDGGLEDVNNTVIVPLSRSKIVTSDHLKRKVLALDGCMHAVLFTWDFLNMLLVRSGESQTLSIRA